MFMNMPSINLFPWRIPKLPIKIRQRLINRGDDCRVDSGGRRRGCFISRANLGFRRIVIKSLTVHDPMFILR